MPKKPAAMRSIMVDKISSVTQACGLSHELRVSGEIPCEEGIVLAVEILTDKSQYNTLELTSGRMAKVARGNVVVGALGHRKALFGYSGHLPAKLAPGDVIQMLNIGGVLGVCDSANPEKGRPFDCRVLGTVLHFPYLGERIGVPARVGLRKLDYGAVLETNGVPVVALAGTCMEAGKTAAACAMISRMRHRGLVVDGFKATGVSLRRDILAFEDSGARRSMIFTDFGIVTTTPKTGPALTRTMLTEMAAGRPDVIVFELGDGILGAYGVEAILDAPDIRQSLTAVVLSANDPVAAWGGVKLLRERFGIEPAAVTGPSTDNSVGVDIIRERLNVPAFNAMTNGAALGDCGHRLRQPARRARRAGVPAPRGGLRRPALRLARGCGRGGGAASEKRGPRGRAPRRFPQADRRPAYCRGCQRREARRRRHLRGLPLRGPGRLRTRLQTPARRPGARAGIHLRGTRAPRSRADTARRPSGLLRH